ncbi:MULTISPECIES: helix-turn-helix domain-containing protein [Bacillus cereus group]|uniref:Helix-turn-helix transcriptional regulator n=1 Tax=Bacillus cereus TaxID=1396 RepID=A0AAW5L3G6_BACCE|nr:helix-turn-helix transcriptional regulator [Bacillus cereus]MCQ6288748.1 helix-turn-helix transcriptional regulator [Bacillus cereus]MCQ6307392.1 helix-turn-helix transcriptional regulator [Bacillus cereus]MCQ6318151.1 helix-turn-helix transcriptional regulator [Bacillus cereus]MCQ6328849.1 helix-turn-helix transcriptional regulator [Bacillus cereus]MCQ6343640.1 helix-turn-helix transcriptional regulator [Bacillus cereus]
MKLNIEKAKSLRRKQGYTQSYVGSYIGYSAKSAYSQIESGKRQPNLHRLGLLSKLYGVTVEELLES